MLRNPSRRQVALFSGLTLAVTALLVSGCTPRDPWNKPQTSVQQFPDTQAPQLANGMPISPIQPPQARAAKVAILLPLSGKGSDTGQAMLNAAQLAVFDLNATTFELIPRDTMGTPDGARDAATTAASEGAQLILGPVFSNDAKAVTPVALQRGLSTISFSTDTSVASSGGFVLGFLPQSQITQAIDFAATQGVRKIALIAPQDAYGETADLAFKSHIMRRSLMTGGIVRYNPTTGTTPEQIKSLLASNFQTGQKPFDAVIIAAPGAQAGRISQQLSDAGAPPSLVQRIGTGLWDQADVARIPSLQGAYYAASSPRLREKFEARYQQTYGETAPRLASLAYDATALAIVLSRSNQDYSRPTLINPNGFSGIDGIFRFRNDGLVERGLAILQIRNGSAVVIKDAPSSFQALGG